MAQLNMARSRDQPVRLELPPDPSDVKRLEGEFDALGCSPDRSVERIVAIALSSENGDDEPLSC